MRRLALFLLACAMLALGTRQAAARTPVDVALVLAVDASGSIEPPEFQLQKEGIALAVTDASVVSAVTSGSYRRIAIAYVEWGAPGAARTVVDWHIVEDAASAQRFAAAVLAAPRSSQSYNAIGDAILHGVAAIQSCGCEPARSVIDISGDNRDMRSLRPAPLARDDAVAAGVTVNALAILEGGPGAGGAKPWLVEDYERNVIGGPGSFVLAAEERKDFMQALRRKLVPEIAER